MKPSARALRHLPAALLERPIEGRRLAPARTLAELLKRPTWLVFLRHCG